MCSFEKARRRGSQKNKNGASVLGSPLSPGSSSASRTSSAWEASFQALFAGVFASGMPPTAIHRAPLPLKNALADSREWLSTPTNWPRVTRARADLRRWIASLPAENEPEPQVSRPVYPPASGRSPWRRAAESLNSMRTMDKPSFMHLLYRIYERRRSTAGPTMNRPSAPPPSGRRSLIPDEPGAALHESSIESALPPRLRSPY
jgi:hypothetical protein